MIRTFHEIEVSKLKVSASYSSDTTFAIRIYASFLHNIIPEGRQFILLGKTILSITEYFNQEHVSKGMFGFIAVS
jgi:hypothetical protein